MGLARAILCPALALFAWDTAEGANPMYRPARATMEPSSAAAEPAIVIRTYDDGLAGVRATNPEVRLSVGRAPELPGQRVLIVEYPAPSGDPAGRDVQCAAENEDWSAGRAISFQIRPDHSLKLSVSFLDRNRVAYTAWRELEGGVWQLVRIPFDEIRPNPYFQPPDAKTGGPIDLTEVKGIAFAPQDQTSGRLLLGRFVVSR
jgi:hypothetical protein